jgi:cytochrome c biogenesis protein CcdA/thiol-disulfide isomerase/thioredoxin
VLAFAAVALLFNASTHFLGLSPSTVRTGSAILLLLAGGVMIFPGLSDRMMGSLSGVSNLGQRISNLAGGGALGAMLLGAALGIVWTPCAGPVLASILALIAGSENPSQSGPLLLAYALGAGLPMLLIAYGGQTIMRSISPLMRHTSTIRKGFGVAVMLTALAMLMQLDSKAIAWATSLLPSAESDEHALLSARTTPIGENAPEFMGVETWLNVPGPLAMSALKGKVVLIDFWTYSCINCIRTLPHIQKLHERYASQGLVVIGVHTPEFSFERSASNVRDAMARFGLTYPVALDNRYQTWEIYRNNYWPAQYIIDRKGRIVFQHAGEGQQEEIENRVRQALSERP